MAPFILVIISLPNQPYGTLPSFSFAACCAVAQLFTRQDSRHTQRSHHDLPTCCFPPFVIVLLMQRAALLDIYAISQEQGMPIDRLMDMYLPDTSTAFKAYMVDQMRSIGNEQLQALKARLIQLQGGEERILQSNATKQPIAVPAAAAAIAAPAAMMAVPSVHSAVGVASAPLAAPSSIDAAAAGVAAAEGSAGGASSGGGSGRLVDLRSRAKGMGL
jgi:hypothetical protein